MAVPIFLTPMNVGQQIHDTWESLPSRGDVYEMYFFFKESIVESIFACTGSFNNLKMQLAHELAWYRSTATAVTSTRSFASVTLSELNSAKTADRRIDTDLEAGAELADATAKAEEGSAASPVTEPPRQNHV